MRRADRSVRRDPQRRCSGPRLVALLVLVLAAGCKGPLPLDGHRCPCVAGYTCDATDHVCVRDSGAPDGGAPDGGEDCVAATCRCSVATEAMDCGPHQFCDIASGAHRCACVAGYTDTGQGCAWTGTIHDPGISEPGTWTAANGALLNPSAFGGIDPGEASFTPSTLCMLAHVAATEADLWLYDPATRTVISGDLVVAELPFLDTACPDGWRKALGEIAAMSFDRLVPGYGAAMTRAAFSAWRTTFEALLDCAAGSGAVATCIAGWHRDAAQFIPAGDDKRVDELLGYYLAERLRSAPARERFCRPLGAAVR